MNLKDFFQLLVNPEASPFDRLRMAVLPSPDKGSPVDPLRSREERPSVYSS